MPRKFWKLHTIRRAGPNQARSGSLHGLWYEWFRSDARLRRGDMNSDAETLQALEHLADQIDRLAVRFPKKI